MKIPSTREKVLSLCPNFERVDPFMRNRVSSNSPAVGLWVGVGVGVGVHPRRLLYVAPAPVEPAPTNIESVSPPVFEQTSASKRKATDGNSGVMHEDDVGTDDHNFMSKTEPPESFVEAFIALAEQKCLVVEKKLELQKQWHEKQFELESKKLDIQREELALQSKEAETRNLQLQLELARVKAFGPSSQAVRGCS